MTTRDIRDSPDISVDELYSRMREKLHDVVPEFELRQKAEIAHDVLRLKRERNAVILAHNYMEPALYHSVPDFKWRLAGV